MTIKIMKRPEHDAPADDAGALIDRAPVSARPDDRLGPVAWHMLREGLWGVPIVDADNVYVGMVTLRGLADCCLGAAGGAMLSVPTLRFMRNGLISAREQFKRKADRPVAEFMDTEIRALDEPVSVPEAMMLAYRGQLIAPVVRERDKRLMGVLRLDDLLRAVALPA